MNILRIEQVTEKTTLCRRTIYNYTAQGRFPAKLRLGGRVGWLEEEVNDWLRARANERDNARAEEVADA